ncbi:MAG: OmpA family protein [Paracoccaceae bacterium]
MSISRRALMLGIASAGFSGCSYTNFNGELGARLDEGGFGNPTRHNMLVHTGQLPYIEDLGERFAREVPTTVNFEFDSTRLDQRAQILLMRQARWIRQFPEVRFSVYGHADLTGSESYNRSLGLRRARAVVNFLVRQGVSRSRLEALESLGESQPVVQTEDREPQNRRAETRVSGFLQDHPTVMNGQYAYILHRNYVESDAPEEG